MPIYPYKCPSCSNEKEVYKNASDAHIPEICDNDGCGRMMVRVWTAPMLEKPFFAHYDIGLGKHISSKSDMKKAIHELNSKGMNIECVGNDRLEYKKQKETYDIPEGTN